MLKKTIILSYIAFILCDTALRASGAIAGATEPTQVTQLTKDIVDRVKSYTAQLQEMQTLMNSYKTQMNQLTTMVTNLRQLPQTVWGGLVNDLYEIKDIIQNGLAISYATANFEQQFKDMYPDYEKWEKIAKQEFGTVNVHTREQHEKMAQSTSDGIKGVLRATGKQFQNIINDDEKLKKLLMNSEGAEGQLQVLQATNRLLAHQTEQFKALHTTLLNQTQLYASYMEEQTKREQGKLATQKELTANRTLNSTISRKIKW
ncbi:MAG: P-type conjugative transfer protein TrbJ [Endomicrobium sp.]|jgi:P-type conjugative transfer protein TrbJ|nr:P-type conjugative transfer protein TrbJ [Endomicrobium sp.]